MARRIAVGLRLSRQAICCWPCGRVRRTSGVSQPSINQGYKLLAATHRVDTAIAAIKANRATLESALGTGGFSVGHLNKFVFFACKNAEQAQRMFESLGDIGISVRCFPQMIPISPSVSALVYP
jgi:histidinol-phosphate/aromatic aminotransferase/cobyric acid decarboxylase-like protein